MDLQRSLLCWRSWCQDARSLATPEARRSALSSPVSGGWVAGLQQLADAVSAATLTAVAAFDAAGDGQTLHGAASTQAWLRGACRVTGAEAAERVRIARASRDLLAGPVEQVRDGALTYEHLRAVERGIRHLPQPSSRQAVELLTDLAQVGSVGRCAHRR